MPAEIERSVRKWLLQLDSELAATPPDVQGCRAAFSTLRDHVDQLLSEYFSPISLPARRWSDALLAQARDDLRAVEVVAEAKGAGLGPGDAHADGLREARQGSACTH